MGKKICLLLLLLLALSLGGCSKKEESAPAPPPPPPPPPVTEQHFLVYRGAAEGFDLLLPEEFTVADNGHTPVANALDALLYTKPRTNKAVDVIPRGVQLRELRLVDGVAYVDLSQEAAAKGLGSSGETLLVYSIVNTLTQFPQVKAVQLLVEGQTRDTLSGHIDVSEPIKAKPDYIAKK